MAEPLQQTRICSRPRIVLPESWLEATEPAQVSPPMSVPPCRADSPFSYELDDTDAIAVASVGQQTTELDDTGFDLGRGAGGTAEDPTEFIDLSSFHTYPSVAAEGSFEGTARAVWDPSEYRAPLEVPEPVVFESPEPSLAASPSTNDDESVWA